MKSPDISKSSTKLGSIPVCIAHGGLKPHSGFNLCHMGSQTPSRVYREKCIILNGLASRKGSGHTTCRMSCVCQRKRLTYWHMSLAKHNVYTPSHVIWAMPIMESYYDIRCEHYTTLNIVYCQIAGGEWDKAGFAVSACSL